MPARSWMVILRRRWTNEVGMAPASRSMVLADAILGWQTAEPTGYGGGGRAQELVACFAISWTAGFRDGHGRDAGGKLPVGGKGVSAEYASRVAPAWKGG